MSKCNNHPITVPRYERDLKTLAESVENLRYDALSEFLQHLSDALYARAIADSKAGKEQLSMALGRAEDKVSDAKIFIDKAWKICKPYMDEQ